MALPAILLKAKDAIKTGAKVKQVGKQLKSNTTETESETNALAKKGFKFVALLSIPVILFMIFIVVIVSLPQTLFTMFGAIGEGNSGNKGTYNGDLAYLQWAIDIANDDSHGYSQCNRTGPDYDCSSLVWYALVEGGGFNKDELNDGYAFATGDMPKALKKVGFKEYQYTGHEDLQPGDILLRSGHTGMYVGDGQTVEAHSNEHKEICGGQTGDQTGHEISVEDSTSSWETYYRWEG